MKHENVKIQAGNKKAFHDFFILDKLEAGIELQGWEVKSVRAGTINLVESFVYFQVNKDTGSVQAFLKNAHFSRYNFGVVFSQEPRRDRRLLLHRTQIIKFHQAVAAKGLTCVATKIYLLRGKVKVELAIARGKHNYDKKKVLKERDIQREAERSLRNSLPS